MNGPLLNRCMGSFSANRLCDPAIVFERTTLVRSTSGAEVVVRTESPAAPSGRAHRLRARLVRACVCSVV